MPQAANTLFGLILLICIGAIAPAAVGEKAVVKSESKIIRITVLKRVDDSNQILKVLESEIGLERFQKIWSMKTKTDALKKQSGLLIWPYSLKMEDSERSNIWLVSAEGIVAPLNKVLTPAYQLADPKAFFKLISE